MKKVKKVKKKARPTGRPPLPDADRRSGWIQLRVQLGEKADLVDAAEDAGLTLSAFILRLALRAARRGRGA